MTENHRRSLSFFALHLLFFFFLFTTSANAETYSYDALGNLQAIVYDDGSYIQYRYDNVGNRTSITEVPDPVMPVISSVVDRITNTVNLTVTAGDAGIQNVYIDWMDASNQESDLDMAPGANSVFTHTYGLAPRFEKIYKIRIKIQDINETFHYITHSVDVR